MKLVNLFLLFIVLCSLYAASNADPKPPVIPGAYNASVYTNFSRNGLSQSSISGPSQIWYDNNITGFLMETKTGIGTNFSMLNTNNVTEFIIIDEVCRPQPGGGFFNMWSWIQVANYSGNITVNGVECELWTLPFQGTFLRASTHGNVPCTWEVPFNLQGSNWTWSMTYESFEAGAQKASVFVPPYYCQGDGFICPNGKVEDIEIYRFHPETAYTLDNRNAADLLGDTAYVCYAHSFGVDSYITLFTISVNSSWGQYALCNEGICAGLNNHSVGREASYGVGYLGGQCSNNKLSGSWYSFNEVGECENGTTVGTDGCSWAIREQQKTISASCLQDLGFFNACTVDGGPPYYSAQIIFMQAFLYNTTEEGGCPNTQPPTEVPLGVSVWNKRQPYPLVLQSIDAPAHFSWIERLTSKIKLIISNYRV